jgi:hypothetical protein
VNQVALDKKMAFGYYKLPVVMDTGRFHSESVAPVMGVWCPILNDRSSILKCSSCPQFGGLDQDPNLTHTFVRCRCSDMEKATDTEAESTTLPRARKLRLEDVWRR